MRSPRLNVSLPPEIVRIVATIAQAQGVSQARVIRDILVEASPALAKIAAALANVERMKAEKRTALEAVLSQAQREAESLAATSMALLERVAGEVAPEGATDAERPAPDPRRAPPPLC
jgi:predicted HicB family RNase H-like nuclease